jgi:type II secretory pathway pseudopilin PulG
MKREALGRAERWCLAATIVCGVPLVVAPIWWHRLNADVVVSIPNSKLPSPNAYDSYVAATQQLDFASRNQIAYAVRPYQVGTLIPVMPISSGQSSPGNGPAPTQKRAYSSKEKSWLLKRNMGALQTLRKGFAFPYLQPPSRSNFYDPRFQADDVALHYVSFRQLSNILTLQAQLQKARGDWNGALNTSLDGVHFGMDIARGAPAIGAITGESVETRVRSEAWPCVPHLSPSQARSVLSQLQKLEKGRVPFAQTLQEQKWALQAALVLEFHDSNWRNTLFNNRDNSSAHPELGMRGSFISKQEIIDRIGHNLDAQIANARLPYTRQQKVFEKPDPLDEILGVTSFLLDSNRFFIRCQAQSALLMTALALQAYRAEHKSYPPTLNSLVPRYLRAVPHDPFSDNQPLRYKLRPLRYVGDIRHILTGRMVANRNYFRGAPSSVSAKIPETKSHLEYSISPYTLYSIGANGKDDGGQPIENKAVTTSARDRYSTDSNQNGDLVAGVNVQ